MKLRYKRKKIKLSKAMRSLAGLKPMVSLRAPPSGGAIMAPRLYIQLEIPEVLSFNISSSIGIPVFRLTLKINSGKAGK